MEDSYESEKFIKYIFNFSNCFFLNYSFGNTRVDEFSKKLGLKKINKIEIDSSLSKADNAEIIVYEQHLVVEHSYFARNKIDRSYEVIKTIKGQFKYSGPSSKRSYIKFLDEVAKSIWR